MLKMFRAGGKKNLGRSGHRKQQTPFLLRLIITFFYFIGYIKKKEKSIFIKNHLKYLLNTFLFFFYCLIIFYCYIHVYTKQIQILYVFKRAKGNGLGPSSYNISGRPSPFLIKLQRMIMMKMAISTYF
jgi:hypothetical protein